MRVLVLTVVHNPEDARILHRQVGALVDAGHQVEYGAPFVAFGTEPRPWVIPHDLPRATGRRRVAAVRAARRLFRDRRADLDLVLLHDPELLLAVRGVADRPPVVWDVHEDTAAALGLKPWVPAAARAAARAAVRRAESAAERSMHLILAERAYANRFRREHPVVPNQTTVPAEVPLPGARRVVYLGWLSQARGGADLIEVGRLLRPHGVRVELIGYADAGTRDALDAAVAEGAVDWSGFLPNDAALARLDGALAGLSLLHDEPNYRHSLPTKIIEYMAHGLPVVTTPSPEAVAVVQRHLCGSVVPWADPAAVTRAVLRLRDDATVREDYGRRGHQAALAHYHWPDAAPEFVAQLERWAAPGAPRQAPTGARRRPARLEGARWNLHEAVVDGLGHRPRGRELGQDRAGEEPGGGDLAGVEIPVGLIPRPGVEPGKRDLGLPKEQPADR